MKDNSTNRKLYAIKVKNEFRKEITQVINKTVPVRLAIENAFQLTDQKIQRHRKVNVHRPPFTNCIVHFNHTTTQIRVTNKRK